MMCLRRGAAAAPVDNNNHKANDMQKATRVLATAAKLHLNAIKVQRICERNAKQRGQRDIIGPLQRNEGEIRDTRPTSNTLPSAKVHTLKWPKIMAGFQKGRDVSTKLKIGQARGSVYVR